MVLNWGRFCPPPRKHLAMSEDDSSQLWGVLLASGGSRSQGCFQHPTVHRAAPAPKSPQAPNVSSTEAEKPACVWVVHNAKSTLWRQRSPTPHSSEVPIQLSAAEPVFLCPVTQGKLSLPSKSSINICRMNRGKMDEKHVQSLQLTIPNSGF